MRSDLKMPVISLPSPFLIGDKTFPNLGAIQAATYHGTEVIDLAGDANYMDRVRNLRGDFGISSTTPQFPIALKVARELKYNNPNSKVVLGGPHATVMYGRTDDPNYESLSAFDHVVAGEADQDLALDRWYVKAPLIRDIDSTPIPDRSKVDIRGYRYYIENSDLSPLEAKLATGKKTATTIMTQRGCPFSCAFCCGRDIEMYKKSRQHSPKRVADELAYLRKDFGFEGFMWYDDEVNVNPSRLKGLADLIEGQGYEHRGFVRADLVSRAPESLGHLSRIGFKELCFGLESGDDRVLSNVGKGMTVSNASNAAKLIQEAKMRLKVFAIVGLPGETAQSIMSTARWIKETRPDSFNLSVFNPYPGSKIYDDAVKTDEMPGYEWKWGDLYFNKPDFSKDDTFYMADDMIKCGVRTKELTSDDILELREGLLKCAK